VPLGQDGWVHPFLDRGDRPLAFVHRGGASEAAENSAEAFRRAVELGFRYFETDVHATADGVVLAFHDERLDRLTDGRGLVERQTWAQVSRVRIGGTEPIPLLADLLEEFPDARFNIDAKHDAAVAPLADLLLRTSALDRVCVASFSDRRLARLAALLGPRACLSMGRSGVVRLWLAATSGRRVPLPRADCAQVPLRFGPVTVVDRRFVDTAHRLGLQVHVWTVDEAAEMERLLRLGVDGLMTDRPAVLRDVLRAREAWPG
jgi:glycerophosphoryl diester phosphodiesterase